MNSIIVITNKEKPLARKYAGKILNWTKKIKYSGPKFAVILGGDGMMLKAARELAGKGIPLLGVNLGEVGFLAETNVKNIFRALKKILTGKYGIEERSMLQVEVYREKKLLNKFIALNDAVIKNGESARVINLRLSIEGKFINRVVADGILISTPTGSTAYCLASGGPIVHPQSKVLIAVPVSPHSLTQRPLVFPDDETIGIEVGPNRIKTILSIDGQIHMRLKTDDIVRISISDLKTKLIVTGENDYFDVLKEKFKWGA